MGVSHFKNMFKAPLEATITEFIHDAQVFPSFLDDNDNDILMAPISKGEVEGVLHSIKKEKSQGLDGWTMGFFQHVFDVIRDGLS